MTTPAKSLLVHLDGSARAEVRLTLAHQFAASSGARLSALFAVVPRYLPLLPLAGGVPSMPMGGQVDLDHRMHAMSVFERARAASDQACQWLELNGEPVIETFSHRALTADLLFLGQRDPGDREGFDVPAGFVESVLIDSGRPALILPYAGSASVTPSTVLIAWKSTRECARALTAALPFLLGATRVHLVDAERRRDAARPRGRAQIPSPARHRQGGRACQAIRASCGRGSSLVRCGLRRRDDGHGLLRSQPRSGTGSGRGDAHSARVDDPAGPDGSLTRSRPC